MGDVSLQERCDQFIREFGDDVLTALAPQPGPVVKNVHLDSDDAFEVHIYGEIEVGGHSFKVRFENGMIFNATDVGREGVDEADGLVEYVASLLCIGNDVARFRLRRAGLLREGSG